MNKITLVLDAMGVIYTAADDVTELLVPFVLEKGGTADAEAISRNYTLASLGEIDPDKFWKNVGLAPEFEEEYLLRHRLTNGLVEFLENLPRSVSAVWCLSNDVGRWAQRLRAMHQLDRYFVGFVISGDVGARKPSTAIYQALLDRTRQAPESHLFVDDRPKNLDGAKILGMRTALFDRASSYDGLTTDEASFLATSFPALAKHLNQLV